MRVWSIVPKRLREDSYSSCESFGNGIVPVGRDARARYSGVARNWGSVRKDWTWATLLGEK